MRSASLPGESMRISWGATPPRYLYRAPSLAAAVVQANRKPAIGLGGNVQALEFTRDELSQVFGK
jgi:hypothetical protein